MNNGKILLVEDNDDDVLLMQRAFRKKNMVNEIVCAKDGAECLEILFGSDNYQPMIPALVILDLKLPKISGLEVLKAIREKEKTKGLPVIVLTTSTEDDDIVKSYDLGANSYIRKPIEFEKFVEAVGYLGLYWMMINEPKPNHHG